MIKYLCVYLRYVMINLIIVAKSKGEWCRYIKKRYARIEHNALYV